jgi:hypothetical protein
MANETMTKIATLDVGSGGTTSIAFDSIPATYTDLKLVVSLRLSTATTFDNLFMFLNSNGTGNLYSRRRLFGNGSSVGSDSASSENALVLNGFATGNSATSNTFTNMEIYIPNYAGSTNKSISVDGVTENNGTTAIQAIYAGLWASSAAIYRVQIDATTILQYSSATLYGILKGSGGATVS